MKDESGARMQGEEKVSDKFSQRCVCVCVWGGHMQDSVTVTLQKTDMS